MKQSKNTWTLGSTQAYKTRKQQPRGFSLVEVLVAMFVIVVGIAGITATLWWGTKRTDSGKLMTEATNLGRFLTEQMRGQGTINKAGNWPDSASGLNDAPEVRRPLFDVPLHASEVDLVQLKGQSESAENIQSEIQRFRRNIAVRQLDPNGHNADLAFVTVRIFWNERGYERNVAVETIMPVAFQAGP